MFNNRFLLIHLLSILSISCVLNIDNKAEEVLSAKWIDLNYNQNDNSLFLQIEILPKTEIVNMVLIDINSTNFDTSFLLNDSGEFGDIIPQNNIFSKIINIELPYNDYQVDAIINTASLMDLKTSQLIKIEQQFSPEIVDIIYWQKNIDGDGFIFNPNSDFFQVNDSIYSFLDFQVIINDANGLEDIRYVRYQINIEGMTAEDSCNYEAEAGFLNYPHWFLEYQETTDLGYVFDVNNYYLDDEPGIPIKPLNLCGRVGASTFRFIVADKIFDPIIKEQSILFDR